VVWPDLGSVCTSRSTPFSDRPFDDCFASISGGLSARSIQCRIGRFVLAGADCGPLGQIFDADSPHTEAVSLLEMAFNPLKYINII
jgi:hypothetical protein